MIDEYEVTLTRETMAIAVVALENYANTLIDRALETVDADEQDTLYEDAEAAARAAILMTNTAGLW